MLLLSYGLNPLIVVQNIQDACFNSCATDYMYTVVLHTVLKMYKKTKGKTSGKKMTRWRNKTLIPVTLTPSIGAKKSKIELTRTKGKQIKITNDVTCNMKPRCFIEITIIRIPTCPRISQNNNNSKKIKCGTFQEFQGNLISCLLCTVRPNKKKLLV